MKPNLIVLSIFVFLCSCQGNNVTSTSIDKNVILTIYQVYEDEYCSNIWNQPRLDQVIDYSYGDLISINNLTKILRPQYQCQGDGYYWIESFWFDYKNLSVVPDEFTITEDISLYYGCRG